MIVKKTVFVLGAGASTPYGFPTGPSLAQAVCAEISSMFNNRGEVVDTVFGQGLLELLGQFGAVDINLVREFPTAFLHASCSSLDEFVQPEGNRRFLNLVKAGTILKLVTCENEGALIGARGVASDFAKRDWYGYLLRLMQTPDPATFKHNQVKFITFNFERSLERRLFLMLRSYYALPELEATKLVAEIPVLHLHGHLGGGRWLGENRVESRDYVAHASLQQKVQLMHLIRIVHEELDSFEIETAKKWLREAETICFLGFGYHPLTLNRLGLGDPEIHGRIWGTTLGLSAPELSRIQFDFHARLTNALKLDETRSRDAYTYLREVHVLQTERG